MVLDRHIEKIAVLRALQLGDLLCSVPALRALRQQFRQSKIFLIGLPWSKEFVERFSMYLDGYIKFPGFPSLPEREPDMNRFPLFVRECQQERFDLIIQMHGNGIVLNTLLPLLNARITAGFFKNEIIAPDIERFTSWPQDGHEIHRLLTLMKFLNIPLAGDHLEFPLLEQDVDDLKQLLMKEKIYLEKYVCVHPGAQVSTRRWRPERFAAVADRIYKKGYGIVLTGSSAELPLVNDVARHMKFPSYNLSGKTSLGSLAVLVKGAELLIANDTGVSHIAAALKTPSIIIATGSDPERWYPLDRSIHHVIFTPIDCRPCAYKTCPFKQPCSLRVTVDQVLKCADKFLDNIYYRKGIKCAR